MKTQNLDLTIDLGQYSHQIIQQNLQRFVDQEKAVLKDHDSEPLHQMRVGMRRLRTAVRVFEPAIVLPKTVTYSSIGKVMSSLGETRDLDVLKQILKKRYQPFLQQSEQSKFNKVLKKLHKKRAQSSVQLKEMLKSDRYIHLKKSIESWISEPVYTPIGSLLVIQVLPDLLLPLVCQIFLHPGWLVGTTMLDGHVTLIENPMVLNQQCSQFGDLLHDLRKKMKGVRYQAEFFSGFYAADYLQTIEEFKAIQDVLGELQDRVVLRQFLESTLNADLEKVLPTVNQILEQEQLAFWQSWQLLQERYLALDFRQSIRSLLTTPLAF
jgi:CHAD domain-containing protein